MLTLVGYAPHVVSAPHPVEPAPAHPVEPPAEEEHGGSHVSVPHQYGGDTGDAGDTSTMILGWIMVAIVLVIALVVWIRRRMAERAK